MEAIFSKRFMLIHSKFSDCTKFKEQIMDFTEGRHLDCIIMDLGICSTQVCTLCSMMQLSDTSRGFSFQNAGPLDMRMDRSAQGVDAFSVVNLYGKARLTDIFMTVCPVSVTPSL